MERMTSLELVASTMAWSRSPTELHPQNLRDDNIGQYRSASRGKLLKSVHRCRQWRSIDRLACANARAGGRDKEKGPDPFGIRASASRA